MKQSHKMLSSLSHTHTLDRGYKRKYRVHAAGWEGSDEKGWSLQEERYREKTSHPSACLSPLGGAPAALRAGGVERVGAPRYPPSL